MVVSFGSIHRFCMLSKLYMAKLTQMYLLYNQEYNSSVSGSRHYGNKTDLKWQFSLFLSFSSDLCPRFVISCVIHPVFKEHSEGGESSARIPGHCVPLQPWPWATGLPAAPHLQPQYLRCSPLGSRQRCQLPAVHRAAHAEDPGHPEEGQGYLPVSHEPPLSQPVAWSSNARQRPSITDPVPLW